MLGHKVRCVDLDDVCAVEGSSELLSLSRSDAVAFPFNTHSLTGKIEVLQDVKQVALRVCIDAVDPNGNAVNCRCECSLALVWCSCQEVGCAVWSEDKALEEDISECVVACQVVHALLTEHEQGVEVFAG